MKNCALNFFQLPRLVRPALFGGVLLGALLTLTARARTGEPGPAAPVPAAIGTAPLYFEANHGQAGDAYHFIARGPDCHVFIAPTEAVLVLARRSGTSHEPERRAPTRRDARFGNLRAGTVPGAPISGFMTGEQVCKEQGALHGSLLERVAADRQQPFETRTISFRLAGANPRAHMSGLEQLPGRANYLIGDPAAWRIGVPLFARVQADEVYPGIRLVYYCSGRQLEYDFHVQPHARPEQISFRIAGADRMRVDAAGELVLQAGPEEVRQHRPVIYQTVAGVRKTIAGGYRLTGRREVGFWLGEYDRNLPLVIDPTLEFSTYLGGTKLDIGWGIALDGAGNIYVAGETLSLNLQGTNSAATNGVPFPKYRGGTRSFGDAFVAKFDGATYQLDYLTYLGGKSDDGALGLAVDANGYAYVTGFTDSTNFPVTTNSAFKIKVDGKNNNGLRLYPIDAFVTKLGLAGTNLEYSTLLGGTRRDEGIGIAVDGQECVYVVGLTESTNVAVPTSISYRFPTTPGAYQPISAGRADAFVAKINTTISGSNSLVYSTCLGGTNTDYGLGIAVDSAGYALVTGYTASTNFPVTNALQITLGTNVLIRGTNQYVGDHLNMQTNRSSATDAFVAKLGLTGTNLEYSTYLGGTNNDAGLSVAVDSAGYAYVTGYTYSRLFPTNVITAPRSSGTNYSSHVFVTKIGPNGGADVPFSTEFGGSQNSQAMGVAVDASNNVYVAGFCTWTNFFVTGPEFNTNANYANLIPTNALAKKSRNKNRGFVAVLDASGSNFVHAIYLGGSGNDQANGIAIDAGATNVFIVGRTDSTIFPTNNAVQTRLGGVKKNKGTDAFVQKIQLP